MRLKDETKRLSIIEQTLNIVYEDGIAGLKMVKLAKRVGISVSTLYIYYSNKEDLVTSIHKELLSKFAMESRKAIDEDLPFKLKLKSLWLFWINMFIENSKQINFFRQIKQSPYGKKLLGETKDINQKLTIELLEVGKSEGLIKDIDNEYLIEIMKALFKHFVELISLQKIKLNEQEINTWFGFYWDAIKA